MVEKTHEQTIVIKSEFSKGWVTRMIEGHPKINIQSFGVQESFISMTDNRCVDYGIFVVSFDLFVIWLI